MRYKLVGLTLIGVVGLIGGFYYSSLNDSSQKDTINRFQNNTKSIHKELSKINDTNNSQEFIHKKEKHQTKIVKQKEDKNRVADKKLDEISHQLDEILQEAPMQIQEAEHQLAIADAQYDDLKQQMHQVDKMLEPTNKELGIDTYEIEQEIEEGFNKPVTSQRGKKIQKELEKTEDILNNIEKSLDKLNQEEF